MKRFASLFFLCLCLVVLGVILTRRVNASPPDSRNPTQLENTTSSDADSHPDSPPVFVSSKVSPPAAGHVPDPASFQTPQQKLDELKADYDRAKLDGQRQREEWRQRWAAASGDLKASKASIAVNDQAIDAAMLRLKETETRLNEAIVEARAEAEQNKREQAEQAAQPQPAPQQASDF